MHLGALCRVHHLIIALALKIVKSLEYVHLILSLILSQLILFSLFLDLPFPLFYLCLDQFYLFLQFFPLFSHKLLLFLYFLVSVGGNEFVIFRV